MHRGQNRDEAKKNLNYSAQKPKLNENSGNLYILTK